MNLNWLGTIANFADAISGAGGALTGQDSDFEDFTKILDKLKKSKKKKEEAEPNAVEEYKRQIGSVAALSDEEFEKYKERLKELRELSKEKPKFFERLYNAGMALQGVHVPNRSDERFANYLNQFGQLLNLKRQQASDIGSLMAEQARTKVLEENPLYNTAARLYEALTGRQQQLQRNFADYLRDAATRSFQERQAAEKFKFDKELLGQEAVIRLLAALLPKAIEYYSSQTPGGFEGVLKGITLEDAQKGGLPKSRSPFEKAFDASKGFVQGIAELLGLPFTMQPSPVLAPPVPAPSPQVPPLKPPQTQPPPGWLEQIFQGLRGEGKNKIPLFLQGAGLGGVGSPFVHERRIY